MGKPTTRSVTWTRMNWKLRFEFASRIRSPFLSLVFLSSFTSRDVVKREYEERRNISRIIARSNRRKNSRARRTKKLSFFRSLWQACRLRRHATSDARCRRRCDSFYKPTLCSFSCRTTFEKRVSTFLFSYPLFSLIPFPFFFFYFSRSSKSPFAHKIPGTPANPRRWNDVCALFAFYRRSKRPRIVVFCIFLNAARW